MGLIQIRARMNIKTSIAKWLLNMICRTWWSTESISKVRGKMALNKTHTNFSHKQTRSQFHIRLMLLCQWITPNLITHRFSNLCRARMRGNLVTIVQTITNIKSLSLNHKSIWTKPINLIDERVVKHLYRWILIDGQVLINQSGFSSKASNLHRNYTPSKAISILKRWSTKSLKFKWNLTKIVWSDHHTMLSSISKSLQLTVVIILKITSPKWINFWSLLLSNTITLTKSCWWTTATQKQMKSTKNLLLFLAQILSIFETCTSLSILNWSKSNKNWL